MKAQNKEEKLAKQQEREKLQREIAAREKAERIQSEYEDRLKKMQADMELRQKALLDAQSTIKLLEDQLKETQVFSTLIFAVNNNVPQFHVIQYLYQPLFLMNNLLIGRKRRIRGAPTRITRNDATPRRK